MLQRKQFVKKTRKGQVLKVRPKCPAPACCGTATLAATMHSMPSNQYCRRHGQTLTPGTIFFLLQVVREHYLRDDISSGSALDQEADAATAKLSADAKHYLIVDTNAVLQQASTVQTLRLPSLSFAGFQS